MIKFLLKRILEFIPVLLIISFIVFSLVFVAGNPVALMLPEDASQEDIEQLTIALGLDQPFIVQYGKYMLGVVQGDFGRSFRYNTDALPLVLERLPATLELAAASMIIAIIIAIPLGVWSATKKNSSLDLLATGGAVIGKAMPNFWLGIMLILLFSVTLRVVSRIRQRNTRTFNIACDNTWNGNCCGNDEAYPFQHGGNIEPGLCKNRKK